MGLGFACDLRYVDLKVHVHVQVNEKVEAAGNRMAEQCVPGNLAYGGHGHPS